MYHSTRQIKQLNCTQVKHTLTMKTHINSVPSRIKKRGAGIEHLEAVYARAHTLLAYTTILCCVNTVKRRVLHPPSPPLRERSLFSRAWHSQEIHTSVIALTRTHLSHSNSGVFPVFLGCTEIRSPLPLWYRPRQSHRPYCNSE